MWRRVGWAAACFAAIMGFSRLAYGVLIPPMRASLGGGFALYGEIGTANMIGYLAGSLLTTRLARRPDRSRVNAISLFTMCAAMAASGFVVEPITLGALRVVIGVASGIALALTLALAVEKAPPARRGIAAAVIWGGGCAGIGIVGATSAFVAASPTAWRAEWIGMGVAGAMVSAVFAKLTSGRFAAAERRDDGGSIGIFDRHRYRALAISYFAYGAGYICVVTFFGAALARGHGIPIGALWTVLGVAGMVGVVVWGPLVDRYRSGVPLAFGCGLCACGAALVAQGSAGAALVGALAIGVSFIGVPAMVGALLQQREPGERYPRAFASITVTLGTGQIIGPLAGGVIADRFGTSMAIVAGASALAIAAIAAGFYRRPAPEIVTPQRPTDTPPASTLHPKRSETPSKASARW